jgi:hypothetical protein
MLFTDSEFDGKLYKISLEKFGMLEIKTKYYKFMSEFAVDSKAAIEK